MFSAKSASMTRAHTAAWRAIIAIALASATPWGWAADTVKLFVATWCLTTPRHDRAW
jgi:hypothetical protein